MSLPATTPAMTEHDARRITERIRYTAISARESLEKLQALVTEAQEGQAHVALGYASWTAYLADVLGEQPLRLARDQRQALVGYLAGEGMSTRAIAPIVGASQKTVARDVREVSHLTHVNPETGEVHDDYPSDATTGGEVTPPAEPTVNGADAGVEEPGEAVEATSPTPPARPAVTGLDGKTYQRPEPKAAAKRRPLIDAFTGKRWDAQKAVESLARLIEDDRYPQNAEKVATANRSDLIRIKDQLELVIDALPHI